MKRMSTVKAKINRKVLTLIGVAVVLVGAVAAHLLLNRNKSGEDATPASAAAVSATGGSAAVLMSFF